MPWFANQMLSDRRPRKSFYPEESPFKFSSIFSLRDSFREPFRMSNTSDNRGLWIARIMIFLATLIYPAIVPTVIFSHMRSSYRMTLAQHDIFQDHPGPDIHITRLNFTFMEEANTTVFHCKGSSDLVIQSDCLQMWRSLNHRHMLRVADMGDGTICRGGNGQIRGWRISPDEKRRMFQVSNI
jgi:hypothetical protein